MSEYPAARAAGGRRRARGLEPAAGRRGRGRFFRAALPPFAAFVALALAWQYILTLLGTPDYLLPKPTDIVTAAVENGANLAAAVWTTAYESAIGFLLSVAIGAAFAIALATSRWIESSIYPYAIVMQTIPIVAVAPIIVIWFGAGLNAVVIIAFLIGFFPMLSNTLIGLHSTDQNLRNLFYLYNAGKWQTMWRLRIPAALPYMAGGLKISASLSVVGSIVGEYVAGIGGGNGGLGFAITNAAIRLQTPYLFACGLSASALGILFFLLINAASNRMLSSWHESAMREAS